ncbi:hypothetical protein DMA11_19605 [Marinilabiliaceae bacterium JC017]|nr:hypothetical protein DMA11_19605 [Marinilabiliaceae bacterium JC017]
MENKMKKLLYIFIAAICFVGCEDDDDPVLIGIKDSTLAFEVDTINAMIIGENTDLKTVRFDIVATPNVVEGTNASLSLDNTSDVPTEAYSFPSDIKMRQGLSAYQVEVPIDCSLIPFDSKVRFIKLDLDAEVCPLGKNTKVVIKVYREVPPAKISYHSTFWGWEDGGWYEWSDFTLDPGQDWKDLSMWSWGWCGLLRTDGEGVVLKSNGHPIAAVKEGDRYYVTLFRENEVINEKGVEWYEKVDYNHEVDKHLIPRFKDEWYNQTAYMGIRMVVNDVKVNGWIKVRVNEDGSSVTLLDMAYEEQGLSIYTGQVE